MHDSCFCSVTLGSGDRTREEGCHGGGVYSFVPPALWAIWHYVIHSHEVLVMDFGWVVR